MAWTEIADASLAAGKPITQDLMRDFRDNQLANASKPTRINFSHTIASCPTTYPGTAQGTYYAYGPEDSKSFVARLALWTSGGTASLKLVVRLDGSSNTTEQEVTSTATTQGAVGGSADKTLTFADLTNVSGDDLRGGEIKIELFAKNSTSGQTVNVSVTGWPPCRFARA